MKLPEKIALAFLIAGIIILLTQIIDDYSSSKEEDSKFLYDSGRFHGYNSGYRDCLKNNNLSLNSEPRRIYVINLTDGTEGWRTKT